jgi:hypothetical protein
MNSSTVVNKVVYLFCFGRSNHVPRMEDTGLTESDRLSTDYFGDIAAVYCEVPIDEFTGPSAEVRLEDPQWVGPRAVRHGRVIERTMQYSPVLPARFATLFSSRQSLGSLIERNRPEITRFLDKVDDCDEWSVKAFVIQSRAKERLLAEELAKRSEDLWSLSPGVRYFKEKQIADRIDKQLSEWLKEVCLCVGRDLCECSIDRCTRNLPATGKTEDKMEPVLHWAFLVPHTGFSGFRDTIDRVNAAVCEQGLVFELSGPWPPYSFSPRLETEPSQ